jgi:hypothetical protein
VSPPSQSGIGNEVQVVPLAGRPPEAQPQGWVGLGLTAILLVAVADFARRRHRQQEPDSTPRLLRIFYTAVVFAGTMTLLLLVELLWNSGASDEVALMTLVAFATFTIAGMILFGILDFWLGLFRPRRHRGWLLVAMLTFGVLLAACLLLASWVEGSTLDLLEQEMFQIVVIAALSGIIWWSYLPAVDPDVARLFD